MANSEIYCPDCGHRKPVKQGYALKAATEHNRKCGSQQAWKFFLYTEWDDIPGKPTYRERGDR